MGQGGGIKRGLGRGNSVGLGGGRGRMQCLLQYFVGDLPEIWGGGEFMGRVRNRWGKWGDRD